MKNMNNRSDRNDKVMDIILEAATDKYAQDIANEMVECDMSAEEEKIMLNQQDRIYQKVMKQISKEEKPRRRHGFKKYILLAAALAILVSFAVNASAFRVFLFQTYTEMSGTLLHIKTEKVPDERYHVISQFEYKNETIIPGWLPPGLSLSEIKDNYTGINLLYQSEDLWLTLTENTIASNGDSVLVQTDKNEFIIENIKVLDMDGVVIEICNESKDTVLMASWNSDNVKYELTTNGSKNMLDAIVHNLKFLK